MEGYRKNQPAALGGIAVTACATSERGSSGRGQAGRRDEDRPPSSEVLQWLLADGTKVTVRPSGTEPKIKYYVLLRSDVKGGSAGLIAARGCRGEGAAIVADIRKAIGA